MVDGIPNRPQTYFYQKDPKGHDWPELAMVDVKCHFWGRFFLLMRTMRTEIYGGSCMLLCSTFEALHEVVIVHSVVLNVLMLRQLPLERPLLHDKMRLEIAKHSWQQKQCLVLRLYKVLPPDYRLILPHPIIVQHSLAMYTIILWGVSKLYLVVS